jgi:hypothetical protein
MNAQTKEEPKNSFADVSIGYAYDKDDYSNKFLSLGLCNYGKIYEDVYFLTDINLNFGLKNSNVPFYSNFLVGARLLATGNSSLKLFVDIESGLAIYQVTPKIFSQGIASALGIGFGYKNIFIDFKINFLYGRNILISPNTLSIGYTFGN